MNPLGPLTEDNRTHLLNAVEAHGIWTMAFDENF